MSTLTQLYGHSLALLTDLYQLTMAYAYWKQGKHKQQAVFHLFFRNAPFHGSYALAAGLQPALEYVQALQFSAEDLAYLGCLTGNDDQPLFEAAFLNYLAQLRCTCAIDAVPEGTLAFPHAPLLRIQGDLLQCQLLETPLLNLISFQTLIATKAARICQATQGQPVLEFGLRRAQGIDGGLAASRAAYIGGCAGTSNVLAGQLFGIPVRGTHAHSWVMSFDDEMTAFQAYAEAMPNNSLFLVDTYDTLQGVEHAIVMGRWLREQGHELLGIRLDSGDLATLSQQARERLDAAGFSNAVIVASNDLDEYAVQALNTAGAKIALWGIGTKLVTAYDQPALGGVYKLGAIQQADGTWQYRLKLSEETLKISNPGILQVRRYFDAAGGCLGDVLYDVMTALPDNVIGVDLRTGATQAFNADLAFTDLLQPMFRNGQVVAAPESLNAMRTRAHAQLQQLPNQYSQLDSPTQYPLYLEKSLYHRKQHLIQALQVHSVTKEQH